jgi:hypothetical protein
VDFFGWEDGGSFPPHNPASRWKDALPNNDLNEVFQADRPNTLTKPHDCKLSLY